MLINNNSFNLYYHQRITYQKLYDRYPVNSLSVDCYQDEWGPIPSDEFVTDDYDVSDMMIDFTHHMLKNIPKLHIAKGIPGYGDLVACIPRGRDMSKSYFGYYVPVDSQNSKSYRLHVFGSKKNNVCLLIVKDSKVHPTIKWRYMSKNDKIKCVRDQWNS